MSSTEFGISAGGFRIYIESNYEAGSRPYGSSADGLRACK